MKKTLIITLLCALFLVGKAQNSNPGTYDESFGNSGMARLAPSSYFDFISAVVVQEDGKIITVGRSRQDGSNYWLYVSRQNPDGSLDATYGEGGYVLYQAQEFIYLNEALDAVLAPDGSLMVAGHVFDPSGINKSFVLNVDENGFVNTYFGDNGCVFSEDGHGIVYESIDIDSHGRIIVSGYKDDKMFISRFKSNGEIDESFGTNGSVVIEFEDYDSSYAWSIKCDEYDNVIVGGTRLYNATNTQCAMLCRLDETGTMDTSFGIDGVVDLVVGQGHEYVLAMEIQPGGNYIVAGHSWLANEPDLEYEAYVTRVTPEGQVDGSFGTNGYTRFSPFDRASHSCYGLTVAHDGQIFGTFYAYVFNTAASGAYVFNLDANGNPNTSFADNGLFEFVFTEPEIQTSEAALQMDGKLLIGGYLYDGNIASDVFVARLNTSVEPQEPTVPSEIALEVEVLSATSAKVIAAPNEYTTEYHIGVISQDEFNELGQMAVVDAIRNDGEAYNGEQEFTFSDLEANTYYYVVATGLNAENEWGETALSLFKTQFEGVDEMNNDNFRLFPNPASSMIFVETDSDAKAYVSIHDLTGRCVKEMEINGNTSINIEDLTDGMYFVKIQNSDNQIIRKIVVE